MNEEAQKDRVAAETIPDIVPITKLIDMISRYLQMEAIFGRLEEEVGTCVCRQVISLSLRHAAEQFGFNLEILLKNLHAVIQGDIRPTAS